MKGKKFSYFFLGKLNHWCDQYQSKVNEKTGSEKKRKRKQKYIILFDNLFCLCKSMSKENRI